MPVDTKAIHSFRNISHTVESIPGRHYVDISNLSSAILALTFAKYQPQRGTLIKLVASLRFFHGSTNLLPVRLLLHVSGEEVSLTKRIRDLAIRKGDLTI